MTTPQPITMDSVVVGKSARMRAVFEFLRVIGNSDSTVLITGESGTGKEVMATLIHQTSRRKHHPFVAVSCALFTETLIESELFGHERGAFTGAIKDRPGRFELADGGDIELMTVNGNSAEVRLTGMCAGCPSAHMTLHVGVESAMRDEIPEFETLRLV